ncbi:hypothetical protein KO498_16840 [Lentibacter algarum]|uniref:hypothetical protein n=1 Tax=Lentibacter algarum TaxID=576131 RepID=UPI001C07F9AC|nr:hypothetical protein [Lentibacter algarum]MBU2983475.1 hypothetical protein [Lentibacter algarum]
MTNDHNWKTTLADVRRAYRLIAAYHTQTHHLLREIETLFPELAFANWEPYATARPPSARKRPWDDKWTWDGLPYHNTLTYFLPNGTSQSQPLKAGDWFILARLDSDSAVFHEDNVATDDTGGPDPSKLMRVEEAVSDLTLHAVIVKEQSSERTAQDIWQWEQTKEVDVWETCEETEAQVFSSTRLLEDVFPEGGIEDFVKSIRAELREKGVALEEDARQDDTQPA